MTPEDRPQVQTCDRGQAENVAEAGRAESDPLPAEPPQQVIQRAAAVKDRKGQQIDGAESEVDSRRLPEPIARFHGLTA